MMKFGVGQPVPRTEDPVLLRGQGRYTDDISAPDQVYLVMVRSPVAHGLIRTIDTAHARTMPGVLGIWTATDLRQAGLGPFTSIVSLQGRDGTPFRQPERWALATDRVRYVGDPVACVAAVSLTAARDAAEAVVVEIDQLPVVFDPAEAVRPGAPLLFDDIPNNTVLDFHSGDSARTEAAFAAAAHVVRLSLADSRIIINPMELRSCLATYDPTADHWTLQTPCQGVHAVRNELATLLGTDAARVTVLTGHVGGSFGMRISMFPEPLCALYAARALGRPVKWTEERTPSFVSDTHGRAQQYNAALALDAEGRFLALQIEGYGDLGAYLTAYGMLPATRSIVINSCSMYRLPVLDVAMRCVLTNKSPVGAYRGAGRPEGNYIMERLIDEAARLTGIDRIELRRRNQVTPAELPYKAQSGLVYDSGDFTGLMEEALEAADVTGFEARRADASTRGRLRGLGIGCFLEATSGGTTEMGAIRFEENGTVTIITGTLDYGQGHTTSIGQIVSSHLGIPFDLIRLRQGNSDEIVFGGGSGGSRSMISSGTAVIAAGNEVIEKGRLLAGWALEADTRDIEFSAGRFGVVGTDRMISVIELGRKVREARDIPDDLPKTLDVSLVNEGPGVTFPNGCHISEVEIDEATGEVEVVSYVMVNDIGTIINPLLLEGQLHGGVVQGIGQILLENAVFDENGQLLSGSFMDYAMPRADHAPRFVVRHRPQPAKTNPLGVKGVGEAGCTGSLSSLMNAVVDALSPLGVRNIDMPATPERIWQAIAAAKSGQIQ
ncbi:MAG: xanthine dehydrogenase family protein molybdopterin-binding subunit [Rhodospirillales bacterium]|nr:xanthine dehydrogenase family protein molybdopterin-binding subunit [Rhodospirillales bacterium]